MKQAIFLDSTPYFKDKIKKSCEQKNIEALFIESNQLTDHLKNKTKFPVIIPLKSSAIEISAAYNYSQSGAKVGPDQNTAYACANKLKMRELMQDSPHNIKHSTVSSPQEIMSLMHSWDCKKVVAKPICGSSSRHVQEITNTNVLIANSLPFPMLIEEKIEGLEISAEVLCLSGKPTLIGILEKTPFHPPYFEEASYSYTNNLNPRTKAKAESLLQDLFTRLKFNSGIAHIEMIVNESHAKLIEVNLRFGGGGLTNTLLKLSTGYDLLDGLLCDYLKLPSTTQKTINKATILYLYQVNKGGKVKSLPMPELLNNENLKYVEHFEYCKKGDTLIPYPQYSGLPGFAIFQSKNQTLDPNTLITYLEQNLAITYE
ncbi:MAG: ATP-grasp domain-containing protein [Bdellovibrionota bacterium]